MIDHSMRPIKSITMSWLHYSKYIFVIQEEKEACLKMILCSLTQFPKKLQELRQNWVHSKDYFPPFSQQIRHKKNWKKLHLNRPGFFQVEKRGWLEERKMELLVVGSFFLLFFEGSAFHLFVPYFPEALLTLLVLQKQ